jgi:hypothetical protein
VTHGAAHSQFPSVTARPTRNEKEKFAAFAASRGISESKLALIAIRALLDSNSPSPPGMPPPIEEPATDRITIRLRPGDRHVVAARAGQRGMKSSAYIAALVRSHVGENPPLSATELIALKRSVATLAGLGRLLVQISRTPASAGETAAELRQEVSSLHGAVATLERNAHDFIRAALISWESRND